MRTYAERLAYTLDRHYKGKVCRHGHDHGGFSWRHVGHRNCVDCTREGARRWREKNSERAKTNTKRRDSRRDRRNVRERWPVTFLVNGARSRAAMKGVPFDITPDGMKKAWVEQGGKCYWTGASMDFFIGGARHPLRPSLERIEPALGYVQGNVVWATNFANRARGELAAVDFRAVLDSVCASASYAKHARGAP